MNEMVKNAIISRKESIYAYYEIEDIEQKEKIENLFNRIMEFGKKYDDNLKFETDFATSELNQEYIDLFTELSKVCKPKEIKQTVDDNSKGYGVKDAVIDTIETEIELNIRDKTMPYRRKVREETMSKLRGMPVIGDLLYMKQLKDFFGRFKKKK